MGINEPPVRFFRQIGKAVEHVVNDAIGEHERSHHRIPPPNRAPLQAIPFPDVRLSDAQVSLAIELMARHDDPLTLREIAERIDAPLPVLERHLMEFRPRWRRFLLDRAMAG